MPRHRHAVDGQTYPDTRGDPWMHEIRAACAVALKSVSGITFPRPTPVGVDLVFRFPRPKSHFRTGRFSNLLKKDAPKYHTSTPDDDNLAKAVRDALGTFRGLPNLLWDDDAQVANGAQRKLYANEGEEPGVDVTIYRLDEMDPLIEANDMLKPEELTNGECLRVSRERANVTQREMCGVFGVPLATYAQWESGARLGAPRANVDDLTVGEACRVLRWRHGLSLEDMQEFTGLHGSWIKRAERGIGLGDATALVQWWARALPEIHVYTKRAEERCQDRRRKRRA